MRLLVSACLLGVRCRYDGKGNPLPQAELDALLRRHQCVPVCPESFGGLPIPRPPAECRGDRVVTQEGTDVTEAFQRGAQETLRLAERFRCDAALLKERSPSCGCGRIYDGSFSHTQIPGNGRTAQALQEAGIPVYGESDLSCLLSPSGTE